MPQPTPAEIRSIFLGDQADLPLTTAAELLGISLNELERDIGEGSIVATTTPAGPRGPRGPRTELIAAAMRLWDQQAIESALGPGAPAVLPPAIRHVPLPLHVPPLPARRAGGPRRPAGNDGRRDRRAGIRGRGVRIRDGASGGGPDAEGGDEVAWAKVRLSLLLPRDFTKPKEGLLGRSS